jgi:hypothetical protein
MKAQQVLASIILGAMVFNQGALIASASTVAPTTSPNNANSEVTPKGVEGDKKTVVKDGEEFETKTPESVGRVEKSEIVKSLEAIDGLLEQSDTVTSTQDQDNAVKVEANGTTVEIPRDVIEPVIIASEGLEMEIKLPKVENASEGTEVVTGVVAYAAESNFSNAVQANEDGSVRMTTIIDNPNAPTEYEYQVYLPEGGRLELTEEGGVIVYNQLDEPVSMVNAPWAKDAEGKNVATHFEIRDNVLIQVVMHDVEGVVYPVTADPVFLPPIIIIYASKMALPAMKLGLVCARNWHGCLNYIDSVRKVPSRIGAFRSWVLRQ